MQWYWLRWNSYIFLCYFQSSTHCEMHNTGDLLNRLENIPFMECNHMCLPQKCTYLILLEYGCWLWFFLRWYNMCRSLIDSPTNVITQCELYNCPGCCHIIYISRCSHFTTLFEYLHNFTSQKKSPKQDRFQYAAVAKKEKCLCVKFLLWMYMYKNMYIYMYMCILCIYICMCVYINI
jgi:hypothetical protein